MRVSPGTVIRENDVSKGAAPQVRKMRGNETRKGAHAPMTLVLNVFSITNSTERWDMSACLFLTFNEFAAE